VPPRGDSPPETARPHDDSPDAPASNLIRSPLLRLPYEIVVHILFYVMGNEKRKPTLTPILPTCHYLCQLILSTPGLWGRIYCMPPESILKRFELAAWRPTEIYVHAHTPEEVKTVGAALKKVRSTRQLHRDKVHALEINGLTHLWPHFSWIFDGSLPNLRHLSISATTGPGIAIPLTESIGKNLETLSIRDVRIPALHCYYNLRNLRIHFSSTYNMRPPTLCQLIAILKSSSRLETFSYARPDSWPPDTSQPRGVATLSHLSSLRLETCTSEVTSILDHLSPPAIDSLYLNPPGFKPSDIHLFFRNDVLANRLWKGTPNFPHFTSHFVAGMGRFQLHGNQDTDWKEVFSVIREMVPLSMTELGIARDTLDEGYWREFARRRPEVRSIVSSYGPENYGPSKGLWCALLPDCRHPITLFPKLESVTLKGEHLSTIPPMVLHCLRMRSEAGFKLKRLEVQDTSGKIPRVGRQPEEFRSLADVFEYREAPKQLREVDRCTVI